MLVHVAEGFSVDHASVKSIEVKENVDLVKNSWRLEIKTDLDWFKDGPLEVQYIPKVILFADKEKALANYHNVVSQVSAIELNLSFARGERC